MADENWGGLRLASGAWMPINCMEVISPAGNTTTHRGTYYSTNTWNNYNLDGPAQIKSKEFINSYWSVNLNAFIRASGDGYDEQYWGTDVFDIELFDGLHIVFRIEATRNGKWGFLKDGVYNLFSSSYYPVHDYTKITVLFPYIVDYTVVNEQITVGLYPNATSSSANIYQLLSNIESQFTSSYSPSTAFYISLLTLGGGTYTTDYTTIVTKDISETLIALTPSVFVYDGSPAEPTVTILSELGGDYLEEGVDYTLSYQDNDVPGNGKVVISGIGSYTGSVTRFFLILNPNQPVPYDGLPPAEIGGGEYTPPSDSDPIPLPTLPQIDFSQIGFARIYNPTKPQLVLLSQYMWTNQNFLDYVVNTIKNVFGSPIESIITINLFPCAIPYGESEELVVMFNPTGVSMRTAPQQFISIDCGTLDIEKVYDSALDYNPYTKISCFLPFIGTVQLNADEVMGKTLRITYRIDIVTGACVALIEVGDITMYQYSGNCAMTIPLSASNYTQAVSAILGAAKIAGGIALGAAGGAIAAAGEAALASAGVQDVAGALDTPKNASAGLIKSGVSNTVSAVTNGKVHIERTNSFIGATGFLGIRRPHVIIERPNMVNPSDYGKFNGYPSLISIELSYCHGYTEIQEVQLTGLRATNNECDEILRLLKGGVLM